MSSNTTEIDATIEAVFGAPPDGTDLTESTVTTYDVVSCVVLGLAAASVALRFYVRTMNGKNNLAIDDWTILIGLICTSGLVATALVAGAYGSGMHVWSTNVPRLMILLQVVFTEPWVYAAAVTSTKISILLLYRRLFFVGDGKKQELSRTFHMMFWTATFLTTSYPIIMWIVMSVACRPVSFYWRQYVGATDGVCIDVLVFYLAFGIVNMINDLIILTVPIPRIMMLQMNKRKKVSIMGIMLLGSFVCVASIVRIYYLRRLAVESDVTWILGPAFGWSDLEPSVAIISACLPTFAPLFRSLRNKSSNNRSGNTPSNNYPTKNSGLRMGGYAQTPSFLNPHSRFRIEDDEVELTKKNVSSHSSHFQGEGSGTQLDNMSRHSSENDNGITVKTRIQVTSSPK